MGLLAKWCKGTLTRQDVFEWVSRQKEATDLDREERKHVTRCLQNIFLWYHGEQPLGHFLTAVVTNDFMEAVGRADSTNVKCLSLYAKFLYNYAPIDYKVKAKELRSE